MRKFSKHTPEQIVVKLEKAEALQGEGMSVAQACRVLGISEATLCRWRQRYGSMSRREAKELRELRACQFFCVWGLEVGGDSVGVGGGELGEGLFPVGGGVSLDEAGVSCSFVGGFPGVCEALGGSFVFDVADG